MEQSDQLVYIPNNDTFDLRRYKAYYRKGGGLLYCNRKDEGIRVDGLRNIYIHEYFPQVLANRALCQLDMYLVFNAENTDMYHYTAFWQDALQYAGRPVVPKDIYVLETNVDKGYLTIHAGDFFRQGKACYCCYDLIREEMFLKYSGWKHEHEIPPQDFMDYLFNGKQGLILAQQQLDAGTMPEPYRSAYLEIARINSFMKGKRTVRAWFKGRPKGVLCYPRDIQTAAFIIRLEDTRFTNYLYNYRHDEEGNIVKRGDLDALPYRLTYHSEELLLDPEAFADLGLSTDVPDAKRLNWALND